MENTKKDSIVIPSPSRKVSYKEIREILKKKYAHLPFLKRYISIFANQTPLEDSVIVLNGKSYYYGEIMKKNLPAMTEHEIRNIIDFKTTKQVHSFDSNNEIIVIHIQNKKIDTSKLKL